MSQRFAGQLALVTGSSKGIGAAVAAALAADGAHVILTGRDTKALEAVEEKIHQAGGNATIAPVDLTDPDGIARLASAISSRWEALDMLVLNAAILGSLGPVQMIDSKEFNRVITLNLMAQQALIAGFDAMLRKSDDARLLAITSSVATNPRPFWGAYAASKAALEVLVDCYGAETACIAKIRTAIVNPGKTRTHMRAKAYPGEDPKTVKEPAVVGQSIADFMASDFANGARFDIS